MAVESSRGDVVDDDHAEEQRETGDQLLVVVASSSSAGAARLLGGSSRLAERRERRRPVLLLVVAQGEAEHGRLVSHGGGGRQERQEHHAQLLEALDHARQQHDRQVQHALSGTAIVARAKLLLFLGSGAAVQCDLEQLVAQGLPGPLHRRGGLWAPAGLAAGHVGGGLLREEELAQAGHFLEGHGQQRGLQREGEELDEVLALVHEERLEVLAPREECVDQLALSLLLRRRDDQRVLLGSGGGQFPRGDGPGGGGGGDREEDLVDERVDPREIRVEFLLPDQFLRQLGQGQRDLREFFALLSEAVRLFALVVEGLDHLLHEGEVLLLVDERDAMDLDQDDQVDHFVGVVRVEVDGERADEDADRLVRADVVCREGRVPSARPSGRLLLLLLVVVMMVRGAEVFALQQGDRGEVERDRLLRLHVLRPEALEGVHDEDVLVDRLQ